MKTCFIIAHKYYRNYDSYVKYYVDNINKFHPDSLILIVDNNSKYLVDVIDIFKDYENVNIITNNIDSKFELGAYTVGINWIIENGLENNFDYFFLTQDNFVLKKELDFESLIKNDVNACTLYSYHQDGAFQGITNSILIRLGLFNHLNDITFCWCSSFMVSKTKLIDLFNIIKKITILNRVDSMASERYLARILYELNDKRNYEIDGNIKYLVGGNGFDDSITKYNPIFVEITDDIDVFFLKKSQRKNEKTEDE